VNAIEPHLGLLLIKAGGEHSGGEGRTGSGHSSCLQGGYESGTVRVAWQHVNEERGQNID
jgi:hypothetical protein